MAKEESKRKGKSLEEKLETAQQKLKQLQAEKQKKEARQRAKSNKEERARDTRRKILLGALVLSKVERGEWSQQQLADLTTGLTRQDDRALFNLPPLEPTGIP